METRQILVGDCRETLRDVKAGSVHCAVTSPPYFGLRDYGHDSQIGLESTPHEFVDELVKVFAEVHRVLRDDGTLWVNMGDSYAAGGKGGGGSFMDERGDAAWKSRSKANGWRSPPDGMKPKDLMGVPWMLAFALRDWGWYLRQEIIWHKPAPMPESVQDRCTKAHEHIFLLAKSKRYFYDAEAIKEDSVSAGESRGGGHSASGTEIKYGKRTDTQRLNQYGETTATRNKRSVWSVAHQGFKGAHFAVFPPKLIEPCILAGSPEKCCSQCGSPFVREVESTRVPTRPGKDSKVNRASAIDESPYENHSGMVVGNRDPRRHVTATKTTGFQRSCDCDAGSSKSIVLDPFAGSGTTAQVAQDNGRDWIMCEANPEYVAMIKKRTEQEVLF